jgi:hypothetical protein
MQLNNPFFRIKLPIQDGIIITTTINIIAKDVRINTIWNDRKIFI